MYAVNNFRCSSDCPLYGADLNYRDLFFTTSDFKGGVFTEDVIENWIRFKRENDVDPVRLRPHPYEFYLSFDA